MATEIGYSVPEGSLDFWTKRFDELKVKHQAVNERFGEQYLQLEDPDGLLLNFTVSNTPDGRKPWTTKEMNDNVATVYLS